MIDFVFVIYGFLLVLMIGLAVRLDSRRRQRRRQAEAASVLNEPLS
ncbi:hypothetical protein GRI89_02770 [Altererythrobacter salegens]|uniref:Heme exporter protein D n=1 Tax=Croceibacterium salegens TaxID=1737568 RepID=A0A6I4SU46_9SPHN|nr:hypothetical protein [Croceibacterium salegens]MXO58470.1 hypothetical protein [Croceibacterium salegens]